MLKNSYDAKFYKTIMINDFIDYMLLKTNRMFKWENLPETIPEYILENYLQVFGKCIFYKYNDNYYVFDFSYSNKPDVYNRPSGIIFTNVALNITVNEKRDLQNITDNGVIILNDNFSKGLLPIFSKYGTLITESEITVKAISQLDRMRSFISASDERTKRECQMFLEKIKNGELSVIGDNAIFESVKSFNNSTVNNSLSQYIELIQYLKAQCLNEIGINANYNLKRERLNNSEIQLNDFGLLPLCNLMLIQRQNAVKKINEKFNLDIKVSFSDIWEIEKITLAESVEDRKTDNTIELLDEYNINSEGDNEREPEPTEPEPTEPETRDNRENSLDEKTNNDTENNQLDTESNGKTITKNSEPEQEPETIINEPEEKNK